MASKILFSLFLLFGVTFAEKYLLDSDPEAGNKLLHSTCLFNDDYNDFWVYGYPVQLSGADDIFPAQRGFWTPGQVKRCEIHYYGGTYMPPAKSLTFKAYMKGKPKIEVTSKRFVLDEEYVNPISGVPGDDSQGWITHKIDLTDRALAFNFTIIVENEEDILLLDSIEFDLGDDMTTPTEPPPPTTNSPIVGDKLTLDTDKDYWVTWEPYCHYIEDYTHLWAYGCPEVEQPKEEDFGQGYWHWSPCTTHTGPTCLMRFRAKPGEVDKYPAKINVKAYVKEGKINVTLCADGEGCKVLGNITDTGDKWEDIEIPVDAVQNANNDDFEIVVRMIPSENSVMFLDKVELIGNLDPEVETTTTEKPNDDSAASTNQLAFALALVSFVMYAFQ